MRDYFKVGDRVIAKGTKPGDDDYDVGVVVGFTASAVKVHWDNADTVYTETTSDLEKVS